MSRCCFVWMWNYVRLRAQLTVGLRTAGGRIWPQGGGSDRRVEIASFRRCTGHWVLTFSRRNYFFLILAHSVYKM